MTKALERTFPFETVDPVAEVESYRKEVNRPIYHVHKWWANRLGSVFRAMLIAAAEDADADVWSRFHADGDYRGFTVLDPFMGSGTTVGEAVKLGMKAVGCDINPVSTFAVRQSLRQVAPDVLTAHLTDLERRVAGKIRSFYVTRDRETGAAIPVLYCFWVKEGLSDFFFAWLAPAMESDALFSGRADSCHANEVQDRDPVTFAVKIGRVLEECHRVLKAGGMLAFTFHHSTPDGWLAIYRALASSGFVVAAAHPIKAEMSVGNPKTAAREPINLDAILVCRKRCEVSLVKSDIEERIQEDAAQLGARFSKIGRRLSAGDRFVIAASQVLRHGSVAGLDEVRGRALLERAHARSRAGEPPIAVSTAPATAPRPPKAVQLAMFGLSPASDTGSQA